MTIEAISIEERIDQIILHAHAARARHGRDPNSALDALLAVTEHLEEAWMLLESEVAADAAEIEAVKAEAVAVKKPRKKAA